jgi:hypothetical protein
MQKPNFQYVKAMIHILLIQVQIGSLLLNIELVVGQ